MVFGQIDFVNCLPITLPFLKNMPANLELAMDTPGDLNRAYQRGELDLGAMSAHFYLEDGGFRLVIVAGDLRQHADLAAGDFAIGHGHAQHGGVALHIPAVLQAQGAEVVLAQLARLPAGELVAELRCALVHELAIECGVLVHRGGFGLFR